MNIKSSVIHLKSRLKQGFTLIELLVVIAIIGILAAVVTANMVLAQKQARDARRMQDMESAATALETFYATSTPQAYPTTAQVASAFDGGTAPVDPKNSAPYTYSWLTNATGYCICALLETKDGNATSVGTAAACTFSAGTDDDYFCVQNKQ